MADIDIELSKIEGEEGGEVVRGAIALAADKIAKEKELDIRSELEIISQGRFGIDIRMAIHDALDKMNRSQGGGGGGLGGGTVGIPVRSEQTVYDPLTNTVISYAAIADPTKPYDYEAYVFPATTGTLYWEVGGRTYWADIQAETVIFMCQDTRGFSGAVLVSTDSSSVAFTTDFDYTIVPTRGTMTYKGTTLYMSDTGYWMGGYMDDARGNLKTFPMYMPYVDAPQQTITTVLDYLKYLT